MRAPTTSFRSRLIEFFSARGRTDNASRDLVARRREVERHAVDVFGDAGVAKTWLGRPNRALLNQHPGDLLKTADGIEQVDAVLTRIEHGVIS